MRVIRSRKPWTERELCIIELSAWLTYNVAACAREIQACKLPDRSRRAIAGKIYEQRKMEGR